MKIQIQLRFEAKQTGPRSLEIEVPTSPQGKPIFRNDFIQEFNLSEAEVLEAEMKVLKAIAVIN